MGNSQATNFASWDDNFCFSGASISCGFYGKFLGNEFHFVGQCFWFMKNVDFL